MKQSNLDRYLNVENKLVNEEEQEEETIPKSQGRGRSYGKEYGDKKRNKEYNDIRIHSQNINGISADRKGEKSKECITYLQARDPFSVTAWQEIKLHWPKVPLDSKWSNRKKHPNFITRLGYNEKETPKSSYQQGGVAISVGRKIADRKLRAGSDPLG